MNAFSRLRTFLCLSVAISSAAPITGRAEVLLNKIISIEVKHAPLQKTLEIISRKGAFYFSYNSTIINSDSIVSVSAINTPVKQVLAQLLSKNYDYAENGNYVIIKKVAGHAVIIKSKVITQNDYYTISGYITDDHTGQRLGNASVYEKERLVSVLTNDSGYFSLRLNSKYPAAALTISKEYYEDTTILLQPKYNQQISIALIPADTLPEITTISPVPVNLPAAGDSMAPIPAVDSSGYIYTTKTIDSTWLKRTRLGQFFISAKQKIQSLNIGKFIAEKPYQISLIPGVSTHGKLSGQVVNDVSLNILGGYNAGVNAVELGLLFNINRYDVKHVQLAGVFNITNGSVTGVQVAGIHNLVGKSVTGVQLAGINNIVKGDFNGVQVSGIYNHVERSATGVQASVISNYTHYKTKGLQVAGIANISNQSMDGIQVAGIFNYTKKLHGIQVGLVNTAGSSDGYSIGLINFVMHGYHKINVYTSEVLPFNVAFKTGNAHLYSIFIGGMQVNSDEKLYSFGYGLGAAIAMGRNVSINPEISSQYIYRGSWKYNNLLNKFSPQLNIKIMRNLSITGGPVFNIYYSNQANSVAGYKAVIPPSGYHLYSFRNSNLSSWIGWSAGIVLF